MNINAVEIHVGEPEFSYVPLRHLEARSEARTAFSNSPDSDAVDAQLRQLAASIGADAVINVTYSRGISRTSWNSLKASGIAVQRIKDDVPCPVCAETIKRTAQHCRFCRVEFMQQPTQQTAQSRSLDIDDEPLKSTDNNSTVIVLILAAISVLLFIGIVVTGG